jgi:segregation and condensation protein A
MIAIQTPATPSSARQSPATQAIASLIELAQTGEINPWDVQVIEIIDRFLAELGIDDSDNLALEDADLSHSGQVMLWASKLVLFKAETLERLNQEAEVEEENSPEYLEGLEIAEDERKTFNQNLGTQIKRRTCAPPPKKRKVTLTEFIAQLQIIDQQISKKKINHRLTLQKKKKGYTRKQALKTITELAHNENLTELAEQLSNFLSNNLLSQPQTKIPLDELIAHWQNHLQEQGKQKTNHPQTEKGDRVGVFWALLLLSSQSKVELHQEDFYQDVHITLINN